MNSLTQCLGTATITCFPSQCLWRGLSSHRPPTTGLQVPCHTPQGASQAGAASLAPAPHPPPPARYTATVTQTSYESLPPLRIASATQKQISALPSSDSSHPSKVFFCSSLDQQSNPLLSSARYAAFWMEGSASLRHPRPSKRRSRPGVD
jgi:hypothetical protein